jgi:hypothetical protein
MIKCENAAEPIRVSHEKRDDPRIPITHGILMWDDGEGSVMPNAR